MPAPKRVPDAAVKEAIERWRGNVTAAAEDVGIHPNNLRKRLDSMGVDVRVLRSGPSVAVNHNPSTATLRTDRNPSTGSRSGVAIFPAGGGSATLGSKMEAQVEAPIRTVRPRRSPLRILPEHQEMLREAKLDFGATFRIETDENTILAQFIEEEFEGWARKKKRLSDGSDGG